MDILKKIIAQKRKEVQEARETVTVSELEGRPLFGANRNSLKARLLKKGESGIIAEFKRRSPSKGMINGKARPFDVITAYAQAAASGCSVLTDHEFFMGSLQDLQEARKVEGIPLLRKDFIIDEYQLWEARAYGADVVLLIAANLTKDQCRSLALRASELGLETLLEVHKEAELDHWIPEIDIIGVNNRDLKTFHVDLETSVRLSASMPRGLVRISESGIESAEDILLLRDAGFKGFLIGERFMRTPDPGKACREFIMNIKKSR